MKKTSIKVKITLWLTILMMILAAVLLGFMVLISRTVAYGTAMEQLSTTVQNNIQYVEVTDRKPNIDSAFSYYHNGVSLLVYSQHEALLAGQLPLTFTAQEPFDNGLIRTVDVADGQYLVMDVWIASGWNHGVWLRGLMEAPDSQQLTQSLLRIALLALPLFIVLAALGSYRIAKRAFRPLDHINATAAAINEAKDLSGRIGLPPGRDEFSRLAENFDGMFERLERSFEAEKQFTSDASHELRTPVSIIKGACEFAEKYDETPEERQETIEMIHRQADRMAKLIQQLLSMTRMEQGTETVRMAPVDLGEMVTAMQTEEGWDAARCHIDAQPNVRVLADRDLMMRLVRNLVENAFKYGKPNGQVWISVRREAANALLAVADDGIGIAAEEQDKIWQRFYQVDSSRSDEEGAGLGLAMVRQIAQLHGGDVTLESEVGRGSRFTLCIPIQDEEKDSSFQR